MRKTAPFWSYVDIRPSNVDKKSKAGETDVRLVNYTDVYYNQEITPALELMPATASEEHIHRYGVAPGDIIITKDSESPGDIGIPALVTSSESDMVCAYHLTLLRPDENLAYPRFLYWVLESNEAKQHWLTNSYGVTRYSILTGAISRLRVPALELSAQRRVAGYLDRETGEIDALISKMDKLAHTLKMRKKASASFVWNQDFDQVKLKWLMQEVDNRAGDQSHLPLLSVSIHHGVQLRSESTSKQSASEDLSHYKITTPGQIVLNRMRAFQGGLGQTRLDGLVSPDYAVLEMLPGLMPDWAERVMRTPEFVNKMTQSLRGIGTPDGTNTRTPRINVRDLLELTIPLPAIDKQKRIADHLDQIFGRIDAMLAKVDELKSLLAERRATLVSDVVAGRKVIA
ncbi:restriction endonuclease subunit S [Glutamicibacter arilaitensis]|uniref:restriction endonuclease subunit S n=1 Tax=Glutamicibacter arilaitensis TaxID=256701 RepID=UPI003FD15019